MKESSSAWEIIQALCALQEIDNEVRAVAEERDRLRSRLDQLTDLLERGKEDIDARRRKIADAETWYKDQLDALRTEQDKIGRLKAKLAGVSKNKEYMAIQRELEMHRSSMTEKEEELERFTEALDSHKGTVSEEEGKLGSLEKEARNEGRATKRKLKQFEKGITEISERRRKWTVRIPANILRRYERVKPRRAGMAIVPVVRDRCSGCHMNVLPQLYNILLRRDSLEMCPACNRYIYIPEGVEEE